MDQARHGWLRILARLPAVLLLGGCEQESALQFDPGVQEPPIPTVAGLARYEDRNRSGTSDAGDVLIVPFTSKVVLHGASALDFDLPVSGDSFGAGATLAQGPAANEVTITLGDGASLKTRQAHDPLQADLDLASGIDLQGVLGQDVIENPVGGEDARASTPIDLVAGFVDSGQRLGNDPTHAVALGDLDGDGDLDLVEGNLGRPNRVWFNDGSGDYGDAPAQALGTGSTRAVLLLDVDGDADLDLLVGNAGAEADELWRNDGTGSLELRQVFGASDTWAFAAGDLDGDGDPDLVVADGSAPNVVWENRGGFYFFREELSDEDFCPGSATVPAGCPTRDVALADLDRNGELDLVEGNWDELDLVRLNEEGSFGEPTSIGIERGATSSLALGDLDLDGDPDLVTGDGRDADRIWINVGGSFADSGQRLGRGATSDVALADIDQDGALDLVTAVRGGGNRFWLNDRAGTCVDSRQSLGTAVTAALALGDVDGDGDLDFVAGNEDGANQVWLQSLAGAWGSTTLVPSLLPATPSSSENREIAAVDLDRDGDVDLVLAGGASGGSSVWRGDGSGLFVVQSLSPAVNSNAIAAGDIDGDGDADLVEGLNKNNPPAPLDDRVWLNDGTGLFELSAELKFTNSHSPLDVALADLDANGELDYVYTDATGSRGMAVWLNHEVEFTDSGQSLGSGNTKALAIGDVDSNGLVDFVESFENLIFARRGRIWLNGIAGKPAGFFSEGQPLELSLNAQALGLALGDLDDDGDLDLVSTDKDGGGNHVWFNQDGTGNFEEGQQRLADFQETAFQTVVLADLNGDGALDIVTGGSGSKHASFLNAGDGTFELAIAVDGSGSDARGCAVADVDRDGDADILMALFSGAAEVWFNR